MLSKSIFLVCVLCFSVLSLAAPSTSCTTISGGGKKRTRRYTRTEGCTKTVTKVSTTEITSTPVTTSTVFETSTETVATETDTATETEFDTITQTETITETETDSTSTQTTTTITTYLFPTETSVPIRRRDFEDASAQDLEVRADIKPAGPKSATPGVVCVVNRCVKTRSTSVTTTVVATAATSTETSTSTIVVSETPHASTTTTVTDTIETTSTETDSTTTTTTIIETATEFYTAVPTFTIESSNSPVVSDGTQLQSVYQVNGYNFSLWSGGINNGTLFTLDPTSGTLSDDGGRVAGGYASNNGQFFFFVDLPSLVGSGGVPCICNINNENLALGCSCAGVLKYFQNYARSGGIFLIIGQQPSYGVTTPEKPLVSIVDQQ